MNSFSKGRQDRQQQRTEPQPLHRQRELLDQVEQLARDFADQPDQIGFYLAELEATQRISPAELERAAAHIEALLGYDRAREVFGAVERVGSGAELAAAIRRDQTGSEASRDVRVHDRDPERAAKTLTLLDRLAGGLGLSDGQIEVHADDEGQRRTSAVGAPGLMQDGVVYLNPEAYDPDTSYGREVLSHEVVHVAQRGLDAPDAAPAMAEFEAASLATGFAAGHGVRAPEFGLPALAAAAWNPFTAAYEAVFGKDEGGEGEHEADTEETVDSTRAPKKETPPEVETEPAAMARLNVKTTKSWGHSDRGRVVYESDFKTVIKAVAVTDGAAYLRQPDALPDRLPVPKDGAVPEGCAVSKGSLKLKLGTPVEVIEAVTAQPKVAKVRWHGGVGYTSTGNYKGTSVRIPPSTELENPEILHHGGTRWVKAVFGGMPVILDWASVDVDEWDMTYATEMSTQEGQERTTSSDLKKSQLRYENDGTVQLGTVGAQSNRRLPDSLEDYTDELLPAGIPVIVLESGVKDCSRVIDYAGTLNAGAKSPGWWTRSSNIKKVHPGTVNPDQLAEPVKAIYASLVPATSAAGSHQSTSALRSAASQLWLVNSGSADIRDEAGVVQEGEKLTQHDWCLVTASRTVEGDESVAMHRVMMLDGTEAWTKASNLRRNGDARGSAVEVVDGQKYLVLNLTKDQLETQDMNRKKRPIVDKAAAYLQAQYAQQVSDALADSQFSEDQEGLLVKALEFAKAPQSTDVGPLNISLGSPAKGDVGLSPDLRDRMQTYYQFLIHSQMISGPPKSVSGLRSRTTAHELSTKWFIQKASTPAKRMVVARRLVELGPKPDIAGIEWLAPAKVLELEKALKIIDSPPTPAAKEKPEAPTPPAGPTADGAKNTPEPAPMTVDQARALVETHTKWLSNNTNKVGNKRAQGAQAAEGYPTTEAHGKRLPNPNDSMGISNHCGGEAIDATFPFKFNYFDPIIDAVAMVFGLYRSMKDHHSSPEHWHYERIGSNISANVVVEPADH